MFRVSEIRAYPIGLLLALLAIASSLYGQAVTGNLTGVVTDQSQAVMPNAKVTMTNEQSGDTRRTTTNADGYFSIAGVFPGSYTVTVEADGFTTYKRTNVEFNPGDKRHLSDIQMSVGTTGTEVKVVSTAEQITPVDSGEKAAVINQQQLQNIAVVGRSAAEFIKILPGMAATGAGLENRPGFSGEVMGINGNGDGGKQSALGTYSANGTRPEAMDIVADGSHVSDPGCNCATPVNPNTDMVQEFKVQQSNFAAENAKGPIVMNSVTKSGSQEFHGTGYFYARHFSMNSNDALFKQRGLQRPENKYFFPGGNIGGPVLIPGTNFNKNKDKLFFFTGYEYYKQTLDTGVLQAQVPTEAMLGGDFSDSALLNAFTRASGQASAVPSNAVNGRIPASQIDPGGLALMRALPRPNADPAGAGGGFNFVQALPLGQNSWQWVTRADYSISDNTKLFVRYAAQRELQQFPVQLWWRNANAVPYPTPIDGKNRSDSISASLTHVFTPTMTNEFVFGYTFIDFPNILRDYDKVKRSTLNYPYQGIFKEDDKIPAIVNWGGGTASMYNPGGFDPILFATKHLYNISDNVSRVMGTHTMKFGGFVGRVRNAQPGNAVSNGEIVYANWATNSTGNAYADLLMGRLAGYTESTKNVVRDIYFWDTAFYAQDSWRVSKRLTLEYGMRFYHLTPWTENLGYGLVAWDESRYSNNPADLSKLTGLRWNKIDSNTPKSGFANRALFYAPRVGFALDVFGTGRTVLRGGFGTFYYHDPQRAADTVDIAAGRRQTGLGGEINLRDIDRVVPGVAKTSVSATDPDDDRQPRTHSYSFTISQRLPAQTLFEIAYVGNKSNHLINDGYGGINFAPRGSMLTDPDGDANNYRPRVNYQNVTLITHNLYQNYNALQTTVSKQRGRFNFTGAYTWSKTMGIRGSGQGQRGDELVFQNNYGPLAYDRTHIFVASYVYNLPTLQNMNPVLKGVLGDWTVSGISQWQSGVNLQANDDSANFSLNAPRRDDPTRTVGATYINGTPQVQAQPIVTCDPRANLAENQFINGSCFAAPTPGNNGSLIFPYMRGPAFTNHDLSLFKSFKFTESRNLQFRFSAYNWMNLANRTFQNGDANLNLQLDGQNRLVNNRFGYADSLIGRRVIQLAVKFYF